MSSQPYWRSLVLPWPRALPPPTPCCQSDCDSGRLSGAKFRPTNANAPQTPQPDCDREGERRCAANAFIAELTRDADFSVKVEYGADRYGRVVIDLFAERRDISGTGVESGELSPWPHMDGRPLVQKPDWCERWRSR